MKGLLTAQNGGFRKRALRIFCRDCLRMAYRARLITDSPVFRKFNDALVQAGKNWRRVGLLSSADVVNAFFGGAFAKQLEFGAGGGRSGGGDDFVAGGGARRAEIRNFAGIFAE